MVNYGAKSVLKDGGKLDIVNVNGQLTVRGPFASRIKFINSQMFEYGEPDEFFLNDGTGRFTRLDWGGVRFTTHDGKPLSESYRDQGLSAIFRDINGDHAPDLFIANDGFTEDRFWINDGRGNFREISPLAVRQLSFSAMGVDFADINRDGHDDFFVVEMLSGNHGRRLTQQGTIRVIRWLPATSRTSRRAAATASTSTVVTAPSLRLPTFPAWPRRSGLGAVFSLMSTSMVGRTYS